MMAETGATASGTSLMSKVLSEPTANSGNPMNLLEIV